METERGRAPIEVAEASSASWALRIRRGEPEAVRHVQRRISRILAYKRLRIPEEERADLEQEIMTQVWQAVNRPQFETGGGFWGFVEVVAARRCIDWLRTHRVADPLEAEVPDDRRSPFKETLDRERADLASATLAALGRSCRELISLHLVEGKNYRQLSQLLGCSEGSLRVRMYRCVRSARGILEKLAKLRPEERGLLRDR